MCQAFGDFPDRSNPLGHVGRELHHLYDLVVHIEDRIVGGLDPDLAPALADPPEFFSDELAVVQPPPELLIVAPARIGRIDEDAVVFAAHLLKAISHDRQKILVRDDDFAGQRELDDGLGTGDRSQLAFEFRDLQLLLRNVRRNLDDLDHLAP